MRQLILGTLLGDGYCGYGDKKYSRYPRLRIAHSITQKEYVDLKYSILAPLVLTPPKKVVNLGKGAFIYTFSTRSCAELAEYHAMCYSNAGKKLVTEEWTSSIREEGLAYWYMDDGGLSGKGKALQLHTESFSLPEQELLVTMLARFGILAHIQRAGDYHVIGLPARSRNTFCELIRPFVIPSMQYKLHNSTLLTRCAVCGTEFTAFKKIVICCSTSCAKKRQKIREHSPARLKIKRLKARAWREIPANRARDIENSRLYRLKKSLESK